MTGSNDASVDTAPGAQVTGRGSDDDQQQHQNSADPTLDVEAVVELVNSTEPIDNDEQRASSADGDTVVAALSDESNSLLPRKHAWIHVATTPEPSASTSIFAFVPHPLSTLTAAAATTASDDKVTPATVTAIVDSHAVVSTAPQRHVTFSSPDANANAPTSTASVAIQIDATLDNIDAVAAHAQQTEKTYKLPLDVPPFGWRDCVQLGYRLAYTTMLLRRDLSPRILHIDNVVSGRQIKRLAHAGLAFNRSTESVTIGQPPLSTTTRSSIGSSTKSINSSNGDVGATAVFHALRVNTALRSLALLHVGLGDASMEALAAMLRHNTTLTQLALAGNRIGPRGIQALSAALETSGDSVLLRLDLSRNVITDAGIPSLCRALRENETLVWLDVSWNQLSAASVLSLLNALRDNFVLRSVAAYGRDCDADGYCDNIASASAASLAAALQRVNASVDALSLTSAQASLPVRTLQQSRWVALRDTALFEVDALVIAGLLPRNHKLLTLDLSDNPHIERSGVLAVLTSIRHCRTLQHVNLSNTGLHAEAAEYVADLVSANDTLVSITMHAAPIRVQDVRGRNGSVLTLKFEVPTAHFCDRSILTKCLALNRVTLELNGLRLPDATPALPNASANLSGRRLDVYEVAFLATKVVHHGRLTRLALNSCGIESVGAVALADAVRNHATLTTLELEHNSVGSIGGAALVEAVRYNASLTWLNLSWNAIGDDAALGLSDALQANTTLERLDLRGNALHARALCAISDGLRRNAKLRELYLRWNSVCARGAAALAGALVCNKALHVLDVEHHAMSAAGAIAFARMLEANATLRELNLKGDDDGSAADDKYSTGTNTDTSVNGYHETNCIGAEAAQRIAAALTNTNTSLTRLDMAQNRIGADGVAGFSALLKRTVTLTALDLSRVGMDVVAARAFFAALALNRSLLTLRVAHNRIANDGMRACLSALETNRVLRDLDVSDNGITDEPLSLLLQRLQVSPSATRAPLTLQWICVANNAMTPRTFDALRALQCATTVVLHEETHRGSGRGGS